jgi:hypothetical protein
VEINMAEAAQRERFTDRVTRSLQLVEPPPPHLIRSDHSAGKRGE